MRSFPLFRVSSAALLFASLAGCEKKPVAAPEKAAPAQTASAEPTSFDAVARHLDAGGGLYAYLSTERLFKSVAQLAKQIEESAAAQGTVTPEQKAQIRATWKTLKPFFAQSGLGEISGVGISSLAIRPGFYRTKSILHHYEGKGSGFLWKLTGGQATALEIVGFLPESTAAVGSFNFTLEPLWAELTRQAEGNADLRAGLDHFQARVRAGSGLELATLLAGLGTHYAYLVTLDESKPFTIPHGGQSDPVTIPEPRLALVVEIRDEAVLKQLDERLSALPMVTAADQGELKVRKINLPTPFPFLTPTVVWKNNLLIVSSNEALIAEMLEIKEGKKPGLAATERFKQVMEGLPSPASTFGYVDPLFNKTVFALQAQSLKEQAGSSDPGVQQLMQAIWNLQTTEAQAGIGRSTPEGWITVTNGGPGPEQVAAIGAAVPVIVGAVALPAFLKAKERSKERSKESSEAARTLNDLRLLDASIDQWALEKNKRPGDQPTTDDLKPYLKPGTSLYNAVVANPGATTVTLVPGLPAVTIPPVDGKLTVPGEIVEKFSEVRAEFWRPYLPQ